MAAYNPRLILEWKSEMGKILVIEDDSSIRELVKMTLEMDGHTVEAVSDGIEGIECVEGSIQSGKKFDLILLDIMLPGVDGYEVFKRIKDNQISVIFMTAKSAVTDRVFGLKLGADDYITKPFEPMELLARVEANLRLQQRYTTEKSTDGKITFAGIVISPAERIVTKEGKIIPLTVKEFELLMTLMEHKNQVMTREQLLDSIWGYDFYGGTRTVDVHVAQLRQKLDLYEQLETVYKVGYKLKDIHKI